MSHSTSRLHDQDSEKGITVLGVFGRGGGVVGWWGGRSSRRARVKAVRFLDGTFGTFFDILYKNFT